MTDSAQPFYLVSGFHRSGTSLLANTLLQNGMDMGPNLMGASFANRQGHVEDLPLVELHDQMLAANGQDWRCTVNTQLEVPDFLANKLRDYIASRADTGQQIIGAKDPRAVHFSDVWQHALPQPVKAIFVYRDWRYCISSLLKRHSRELLHYTTEMQHRDVDFSFWQTPELAARMWLSSSEAMLYWLTHYPEQTLILPLSALIHQHPTLFSEARNKGLPERLLRLTDTFDKRLLQSDIPASLIEMLPAQLREECDMMQQRLRHESGVKDTAERISLMPAHPLSKAHCDTARVPAVTAPQAMNIKALSVTEALEVLDTLPADRLASFPWQALMSRQLSDPKLWEKIYKAALKHNQFQVAETAIVRALTLQPVPWRAMYLGDLYLAQKQLLLASQCYRNARKMAPDNATFVARLADVATEQGEFDKARELLAKAHQMDASKPAIRSAQQRLLMATTPEQAEATVTPTGHPNEMPRITNHMEVVATLTDNPDQGQALDDYFVRYMFIRRNNREWLSSAQHPLSKSAWQCLQDYILNHLDKYWPRAALQTELYETRAAMSYPVVTLDEGRVLQSATIGVHLHVYYVHLVPQILAFLRALPRAFRLVVTCMEEDRATLESMLPPAADIIPAENRGRDIAPWLMQACPRLADCEYVLKIHTKSTPHAAHLTGWRLQLLWSLLGDMSHVQQVLATFNEQPGTGILLPPYHPSIVKDIHWGDNLSQITMLADKLSIPLPERLDVFPAGSMFWYRPEAIDVLTRQPWRLEDFPVESGQTDGTLMHAIERLICLCANKSGMQHHFISML